MKPLLSEKKKIELQLKELDAKMPRCLEDYLIEQQSEGYVLNQYQAAAMQQKQQLREQLRNLN